MKINCTRDEADILIRNCNQEQCEFCFLKEVCHDIQERGTIQNLIKIEHDGGKSNDL
jgi:hypothetical protein